MTTQRACGLLLVGLQAAALGFASRSIPFAAAVMVLVVLSQVLRVRFSLSRQALLELTVVLSALFAVKYWLYPQHFAIEARFVGTEAAYVIGQLLLVLEALMFYRRAPDDRLPASLPGWGAGVMVCAFDVNLTTTRERIVLQMLAVSFAAVAAFYVASLRTRWAGGRKGLSLWRLAGTGAVLALFAPTAWVAGESLFRYERDIEAFLEGFLDPSDTPGVLGFSTRAELGSVALHKTVDASQVVLRISAEKAPGYLRGKVFDELVHAEWRTTVATRTVFPSEAISPGELGRTTTHGNLFEIARMSEPAAAGGAEAEVVWPDDSVSGRFFTPLGATHLEAAVPDIVVDAHGIAVSDELPAGHPYAAFTTDLPTSDAPTEGEAALFLQTPPVDPRVRKLAAEVFAGCESNGDKLRAVKEHFHTHSKYSLNVRVPLGADPLTWFLLERPAAHCEFFATGTALMLRLSGVPCRYVTGFVALERNRIGDFWVARNRDAHAWVEAYDPDRGWVIVETTPSAGVPGLSEASDPRQFWDYLRDRAERLRVAFQRKGLMGLGVAVIGFFKTAPGMVLLLAAAAAAAVRWWWNRRGESRRSGLTPEQRELRRLLARMDGRLARRRLTRPAHETIGQFAARVRSQSGGDAGLAKAADWYGRYAALRYRREIGGAAVAELRRGI